MYVRPSSPLPIGGVIDDAIQLYRASFARCLPLALIGAILAGLANLYTARVSSIASFGGGARGLAVLMQRFQAIEHTPGYWGTILATTLIWFIVRAALMARQEALAAGRADSLGAALAAALRHLPGMIVAGILWSLLIGVGTLLLVVPGIWLAGQLQLWLVAMIVEDLGPLQALGRSWRLIERNWWRTSVTVGVTIVLIIVLSLVEGIVAGVAVALFHADLGSALAITVVLSTAMTVFTMPMLTVVMVAILHDLRLRREGGDLAARVSGLQPA